MQIRTGDTKLAKARHGLKPAVVGMSIGTGELVTACLETNILAMEVSTARAKLAVAILMKLTYIGVHVHKEDRAGKTSGLECLFNLRIFRKKELEAGRITL